MYNPNDFVKCPMCAAKPKGHLLCTSCLSNRELIDRLRLKILDSKATAKWFFVLGVIIGWLVIILLELSKKGI